VILHQDQIQEIDQKKERTDIRKKRMIQEEKETFQNRDLQKERKRRIQNMIKIEEEIVIRERKIEAEVSLALDLLLNLSTEKLQNLMSEVEMTISKEKKKMKEREIGIKKGKEKETGERGREKEI